MKSFEKMLPKSWLQHLDKTLKQNELQNLFNFLSTEIAQGKEILPSTEFWFNALNSTPFEKVKVIIIGQDPYPTPNHAHGLCFSVLPEVNPLPKSLLNINKELLNDLNINNQHTGYLQPWTRQGVLLLNSVLTVQAGKTNSHQNVGWEILTDTIIQQLNQNKQHLVFILWGNYAQKKGKFIDTSKHLVIKSPHPSPLSAYRGFFGSQPFSKTNNYLQQHQLQPINWKLNPASACTHLT